MTNLLIVLCLLALLFWFLVRLRTLRERQVVGEVAPDQTTIMVGLFYTLSRACIQHYRDRNIYPRTVVGMDESLIDLGYLKGDRLAEATSAVKLFSIAVSDRAGYGVCLAHTPTAMANDVLSRIMETGGPSEFVDYSSGQFHQLSYPVTKKMVNLTLPLPVQPIGTTLPRLEVASPLVHMGRASDLEA